MRRCKASLIVFMLIVLCLSILPPVQAQFEEPIQNFRVIKAFPDVIYAGNVSEAQYCFDNVVGWEVPVAVNLTVAGPSIQRGEFSVSMELNGEDMGCEEVLPGAFRSDIAFVGPGSSNRLVINISSPPNIQPGNYTVAMELWSLRGHVEEVVSTVEGETHVINASAVADTTVEVGTRANQPVTVTVVKYKESPHPEKPLPQDVAVVPKYIDITVSEPDAVVWPIYVKMSYTTADLAGISESQLVGLFYWNGTAWTRCSETGVNTTDFDGYSGYLWANMTREELSGSPIVPGADTEPPVARISASPTSGTAPLTVSFSGASSTDNVGIVSYYWSFGDGTASSGITAAHTYRAYGTYTATLTVRDAAGNPDSDSLTITVSPPVTPPVVTVPARFELSSLQVSPTTVTAGERVTVSARVSNVGGSSGSYTVALYVNGTIEITQTVWLAAGGSTTVSFALVKYAEGTYVVGVDGLTSTFTVTRPVVPPVFVLSNLTISPEEVVAGEEVTINAGVSNTGDVEGAYTVTLYVNGTVVGTSALTVPGGGSETVRFTLAEEEPGTYVVAVDGLTGSFKVLRPATFELSNLTISPEVVLPGGPVTVSADITNTGDAGGSYTATLFVNGTAVETRTVTLTGGESTAVSFTLTEEEPGTYVVSVDGLTGSFRVLKPAEFALSNLTIAPAEVEAGKPVTVSAVVTNTGEVEGSYNVTLYVNTAVEGNRTVTLPGGGSATVNFTVVKEAAGNYTVGLDGLTGTFTVTAPPSPPPVIPPEYIAGIVAAAAAVVAGLLYYLRKVRPRSV